MKTTLIAAALLLATAQAQAAIWDCQYSRRATPFEVGYTSFRLIFSLENGSVTGTSREPGLSPIPVIYWYTGTQLTIYEFFGGSTTMTAIYPVTGATVHSSHIDDGEYIYPAQYYGQCRRK